MPTYSVDNDPVKWKKFIIIATDSREMKEELMEAATAAIKNNENVAVLGRDRLDPEAKKKVVFLHRAAWGKRLSHLKPNGLSSSRKWVGVRESDWDAFTSIVGVDMIAIIYAGKIPKEPPPPPFPFF